MKANELMIGDWVRVTDDDTEEAFVGRVTALDLELENVSVKRKGEETAYPFSIGCIEGIIVAKEILEKNGFERLGTGYILLGYPFGLTNPSTPDEYKDNYWLRVAASSVNIQYVHQLQHALRLCGIEKEITL